MKGKGTPGAWALGASVFAPFAFVAFGWGLLAGFTRAGKLCRQAMNRADRPERITQDVFPFMSRACHWSDGTTYELVSPWVNPVLTVSLAGVAVCCAMAVRAAVGRRRALRHG